MATPLNILVEVSPLNGITPVTLRLASIDADQIAVTANGQNWLPCINLLPKQGVTLSSNGILGDMEISRGEVGYITSQEFGNSIWASYNWSGAFCQIWVGNKGAPFAEYVKFFEGKVSPLDINGNEAKFNLLGPEADLTSTILTLEYAGTGGKEGPASLKGVAKPRCYGSPRSVEPVEIDPIHLVYQVDGYGPVQSITPYEFGSPLLVSQSKGNVASYAALIALTLVPGEYATCLAEGMFRFGGTPTPKVSADVVIASGSLLPDIAEAVLLDASVPVGSIGDFSAFDGITTDLYITQETSALEVLFQLFKQAGGYVYPDSNGVWQCGKFYQSTKTPIALKADRSAFPVLLQWAEEATQAPLWRVKYGFERCWGVHADSDASPLINELVGDITAAQAAADLAQDTADAAAGDATLAIAAFDAFSADGILDPSEKKRLVVEIQEYAAEKPGIEAQADLFTITTEKTTYQTAYTALVNYLNGLSPAYTDYSQSTPVVRSTMLSRLTDYTTARQALLNRIAALARIIWRGVWAAGTSYAINDGVTFDGRTFVSQTNGNVGNSPPSTATNNSFWTLVADRGQDGAPGPAGEAGAPGEQGPQGPAIVVTKDRDFTYVNGILTPSPQTVTFTATLQNVSGAINWTTAPNIKAGTGATFTLNNTEMGANSFIVVTAMVGSVSGTSNAFKLADPTARPTPIYSQPTEPSPINGGVWVNDGLIAEEISYSDGTDWYLASTVGAQAGTNLYRSTNALLADAEIVTNLGTAAAISGQGPGATAPEANVLNDFNQNLQNYVVAGGTATMGFRGTTLWRKTGTYSDQTHILSAESVSSIVVSCSMQTGTSQTRFGVRTTDEGTTGNFLADFFIDGNQGRLSARLRGATVWQENTTGVQNGRRITITFDGVQAVWFVDGAEIARRVVAVVDQAKNVRMAFQANYAAGAGDAPTTSPGSAVYNASYIVGGANNIWGQVQGVGRPADNATASLPLFAFGTPQIQGNNLQFPGNGVQEANYVYTEPMRGGCIASVVLNSLTGVTYYSLFEQSDPMTASTTAVAQIQVNAAGAMWLGGVGSIAGVTVVVGDRLAIAYDGVNYYYYHNGVVRGTKAAKVAGTYDYSNISHKVAIGTRFGPIALPAFKYLAFEFRPFTQNSFEALGDLNLARGDYQTGLGTAAAITGQTAWATSTIPTARVNNLTDTGTFNSLANIATRDLSLLNSRSWTNLFRADGTTAITDAAAITSIGTAAGIAGQTAWATSSIPTARVNNLSDTGTFNSLANIASRDLSLLNSRAWTNLFRADGSTAITDAAAITSLGTAAAITGQSAWATSSIPTARVNNLSDAGVFNSLANITTRNLSQLNSRAWTNLFLANGTTAVSDAVAVTSLGTAAAITGQSAWATSIIPTARVNNLSDTGTFNSLANIVTRDLSLLNSREWTNLFRADGSTAITDAAAITSLGTAAAIVGQAPAATDNTIEPGADVSAFPSGPAAAVFKHSSTGVAESGEFPRTLTYQFNNLSGALASGVTWQYRVSAGNVNGFASSATWRAMSGTGNGALSITALGATNNEVAIRGTAGASSVEMKTTLTKDFAAPNTSGGGGGGSANTASQSSGYPTLNSTSFITFTNELQVTSGTTTQTVSVNLSMQTGGVGYFIGTVEAQIERWNGSAWVAMGAATQATYEYEFDAEMFETITDNPAVFNFNRTATITAATNQRARLRVRQLAGSNGTVTATGNFILEA